MQHHSEAVSANPLGQLQVATHDGHPLGMDRAQISVLEQRNKVGLGRLLQGQHCLALETHLLLELDRDLPHQTLEGQLSDQQVSLYYGLGTLFWYLRI